MAIFLKDPQGRLDYAIDWAAGYLGDQTITESVWRVEPAGAGSVIVDASAVDAGRTVATLSGGTAGMVYRITNAVGFSNGRSDERVLVVRVEER